MDLPPSVPPPTTDEPARPERERRATFRPHERIRGRGEFQRAFERRRSASNPTLVVYAVENGRAYARLGISVGRKKVRKASGRNRVKRLIREVFRTTKASWPGGVDYVVVPRGPLGRFDELRAALPALAAAAAGRLGKRKPSLAPPGDR